ncbi:MAG TPA: GTP-binding protein, partial [Candidatus Wallbacteria bacterium]|nr:GTP-binding protein [Candidatus Wallbacteria bacterium]
MSADSGVEVGTEKAFDYAENAKLPRIFFVNKIDKENSDFDRVFDDISSKLSNKILAVTVPMGKASGFKGVIDIIKMKAFSFAADGKTMKEEAIPAEYNDLAKKYREKMVEAAAEADEELAMKYLEGEAISDTEVQKALLNGIREGIIFPILTGCATLNLGIQPLLDFIIEFMPNPAQRPSQECVNLKTDAKEMRSFKDSEPLAIFIFKSFGEAGLGDLNFFKVMSGVLTPGIDLVNSRSNQTERIGTLYSLRGKNREDVAELHAGDIGVIVKLKATKTSDTLSDASSKVEFSRIEFPEPLYSVAILPKTKDDQQKLSTALSKLAEEDPTFKVHTSAEFSQTIISGMGEIHTEMMLEKIKRKYNVGCEVQTPRIPYRETIRR